MTSGTFGPRGSISSNSAALQQYLANRLRAKMGWAGSILYRLTWKERVTPSGRLICALRAQAWNGKTAKQANGYSGPFTIATIPQSNGCLTILPIGLVEALQVLAGPTSDSGYILSGWPTPCTQDGPNGGPAQGTDRLPGCVPLAGWPTPTVVQAGGTPDDFMRRKRRHGACEMPTDLNLCAQHSLSGWPTPMAGTPAQNGNNAAGNTDSSRQTVAVLSGWHTPLARDGDKLDATPPAIEKRERDGREIGTAMEARMCSPVGWSEPHTPIRVTASGKMLTGSSAAMESGGRLDPAHSRWLMTLPPEWDDCAPMAMRSTRKPPSRG